MENEGRNDDEPAVAAGRSFLRAAENVCMLAWLEWDAVLALSVWGALEGPAKSEVGCVV